MALQSKALARISPSATVAMTALAADLKAAGRDIVALSAGEPDFPTPEHIREAGKRAIDEGHTRYTQVDGVPELKAAIAEKFRRENGLDYKSSEITVSAGGKHTIFNALVATLDPGDEVVIPAPYWVSYPDIVRFAGGEPVIVPTSAAGGFRMSPEMLEAAITERTKWVLLNSPSNPTGAAYSAGALAGLAEVLRRHPHVWCLSDDIYEHITFGDFRFATIAQVAPDLKDRVLTMNGVSKAYAMTGWRIGYAGGPEALITAMRKLQSQTVSCPSSIGQAAAVAALNGPQEMLAENAAMFERRRDRIVAGLNACRGLSCPVPEGAFYVFPSVTDCLGTVSAGGRPIGSDEDFATALLEEEGLALVFGAAFGSPGHIRLSYAASDTELDEALARLTRFCGGLS